MRSRLRPGPILVLLAFVSGALFAAVRLGRAPAERQIRARLEREAARLGLVARADTVRLALWPVVAIEGIHVEKAGLWSVAVESARLTLGSPTIGQPLAMRVALGRATLRAPGGLTVDVAPTVWDLVERRRVVLHEPARGLTVRWETADRCEVAATDLPLGRLVSVRRDSLPLIDPGVVRGIVQLVRAPGSLRFEVAAQGRGVRLPALADTPGDEGPPAFGPPSDADVLVAGVWRPDQRDLDVPRWRLSTDGVTAAGSLNVADLSRDGRVDLSLDVERVDLARLLEISALAPAQVLGTSREAPATEGLGSASLSARLSGRLADPASFTVSQRLEFTPPARPLPLLQRLRHDFVHEVELPGGGRKSILVSPSSPDFIALRDVPGLMVQTLLLGEDSGFFGHRGIDLSEVPFAILTNWSRGMAARGASTLSQQLAKNLFLSREKRLGRKLQELSLALLLESTLGKERILEIYLNVIEWGPGLFGLRPAARQYFGKEPHELTPAQMALLVALVPGPVKYQRSLAAGTPSRGFRPLIDRLLAKLRSVDALSEEEYQAALAEDLRVTPPATGARHLATGEPAQMSTE